MAKVSANCQSKAAKRGIFATILRFLQRETDFFEGNGVNFSIKLDLLKKMIVSLCPIYRDIIKPQDD
ncbi:MAG: hypothetical protein IJK41_04975 [Muribaculaceae bacterium]|nr:hypothetical protein [Muribaculaceae bacterium]